MRREEESRGQPGSIRESEAKLRIAPFQAKSKLVLFL